MWGENQPPSDHWVFMRAKAMWKTLVRYTRKRKSICVSTYVQCVWKCVFGKETQFLTLSWTGIWEIPPIWVECTVHGQTMGNLINASMDIKSFAGCQRIPNGYKQILLLRVSSRPKQLWPGSGTAIVKIKRASSTDVKRVSGGIKRIALRATPLNGINGYRQHTCCLAYQLFCIHFFAYWIFSIPDF